MGSVLRTKMRNASVCAMKETCKGKNIEEATQMGKFIVIQK